MKLNKLIFPSVALATVIAGCDDQIMEWQGSDPTVEASEIPLQLAEQIALYKPIKDYVSQYRPGLNLSLGMGADMYLDDPAYKAIVDENFTGVTLGNAMKMGSLMKSNGTIDFTTVDRVLAALPAGMKLYGHNMLWHTQQQQTYLKSLIAPEMKVEVSGDDVCINVISNSGFEDGTSAGWTGLWGKYTYAVEQPGHDSDYALHFTMTDETNVNYDCQLFWPTNLIVGETYAYSFYVKSDCNLTVQFMGQNESYGGIYKDSFTAGADWTYCTGEFVYDEKSTADICRVGIQFGGTPGSNLWVDDFKFGVKNDGPKNLCDNGNFADGTEGWTLQNIGAGVEVVEIGDAPSGNKNVLKMTASDASANAWDLQVISPEIPIMTPGAKVELSFYVKSDQAGQGRVSFNDALSNKWPWMNWTGSQSSWTEAFETSTGWTYIDVVLQNFSIDFEEGFTTWQFNLDFGYLPGVTYYIDNVMVTEVSEEPAQVKRRAGGITYVLKSAEEKKQILTDAMEQWIKGVAEHIGDRVDAWDVINEPITDGVPRWRGIDGVFGGTASDGTPDAAPEESEETGLVLNWASDAGNQHWYWGHYLGKDYAVKAFEFARTYAPNAKLFVNDYNLESNPAKLAELINFVKYIDENGAHVDGIGTQMHVNVNISKEQVDAMFKTLAATGKLIRITELDVAFRVEEGKTVTPSAQQLISQGDTYRMILSSYFENVPEAQQSAVTIWTLSDNKKEHEYWLKGDAPNIFDSNYQRKVAYKGVCDAIAGEDIAGTFSGEDWKNLHEKEEEVTE